MDEDMTAPSEREEARDRVNEFAAIMRRHIVCDATGLNPHIAHLFLSGFEEAARAIIDALPASAEPSGWRDRPRAGFDVGNGTFHEGDKCIVAGREDLGTGTITSVYHDGDVVVEFNPSLIFKWRYVLPPPPASEAEEPTPDA